MIIRIRHIFLALALGALASAPPTFAQSAKSLYVDNCAACHGEDGKGIADQGASLVGSALFKNMSNAGVVSFVKSGRQPDAPDSKMKLLMPAFDYMTDDELVLVIQYLRTLK
jgi:mono/diheme cytochrome c family protein